MGEELAFRSVRRSDLPEVIALLQQVSAYAPAEAEFDAIWERFSSQANTVAMVATAGDAVVGYASMLLEVKIRGGLVGHVEDVVVAQRLHSRGVGRALMSQLMSACEGAYKFTLVCSEENVAFYEKNGFSRGLVEMKSFPASMK